MILLLVFFIPLFGSIFGILRINKKHKKHKHEGLLKSSHNKLLGLSIASSCLQVKPAVLCDSTLSAPHLHACGG